MCAADLSIANTASLRDAPAVLRGQQHVITLLAGRPIPLSVYGASRQPHPWQILNDAKIIARWILSNIRARALYRHVPSPIVDRLACLPAYSRHRRIRLQPSALHAAVGISAAMDLLASPDLDTLASDFGHLMQAQHDDRGAPIAISGRQALTFAIRSAHDRALAAIKR